MLAQFFVAPLPVDTLDQVLVRTAGNSLVRCRAPFPGIAHYGKPELGRPPPDIEQAGPGHQVFDPLWGRERPNAAAGTGDQAEASEH